MLSGVTFTSSALAGPPLATDDAGVVDVGSYEIEANGSFSSAKGTSEGSTTRTETVDAELKLTTGLYKDLGIALALPRTINQRTDGDGATSDAEGFGDVNVEIKYAAAEIAGVKLAIKPSVIIPTGASDITANHMQYGVTLIGSKEFGEGRYTIHTNIGYEYHAYRDNVESRRKNIWSASLAGEAEISTGLVIVADTGFASNPGTSSHELPFALAGVRYAVNEHLTLSVGYKTGVTSPKDDYAVQWGVLIKVP